MTREISAWVVFLGRLVGRGSGADVDRSTMRNAAWLMSEGLVLIRLGMALVCHVRRPSQNESSPLPVAPSIRLFTG